VAAALLKVITVKRLSNWPAAALAAISDSEVVRELRAVDPVPSGAISPSSFPSSAAATASPGLGLLPTRRTSLGAEVSANGPHILTIALEDYYQVGAFNRLIQRGQWYRFERRIEGSTMRALDLLDQFQARATFFVLGWVADTMPELVRQVTARGHEVASKGYYHRNIGQLTPAEFRDDLTRAREALERAGGQRILGYRVADAWFQPHDLWALDVLAEEGYEYDSSIGPILRTYSAQPWRRFAHLHRYGERTLWELPISTADIFGMLIPIAGGNYFRQLPHGFVRRAVAHWTRTFSAPYVMYFHTWELDPDQPKINSAPFFSRVRQYRNLDRMVDYLRYFLQRYEFTSAAEYLGLEQDTVHTEEIRARRRNSGGVVTIVTPPPEIAIVQTPTEVPAFPVATLPAASESLAVDDIAEADAVIGPAAPMQVTVVIPCYNEELILPYLANTLTSVEHQLTEYQFTFIFVDDHSSDGTWEALHRVFGDRPNSVFVRHAMNCGVAAGILTGIQRASTDVVCSMDCDCTYDPHELAKMIPLLGPGVDLVTASPYHPHGFVRNVPRWRLGLSKSLSHLYRIVLHQKLATYTSCFRVYRRSAASAIRVEYKGFLGVAEMLGWLDLHGSRIVEFPTTLEVRMIGRSKMKVFRTILGHLALLARLAILRVTMPRVR
jgi:polysaccharide deacetylase family protein (PEP-CTERM system associated)